MSPDAAVISVHDQIAAQLRADVMGGKVRPGEPLREAALARRFGVSRSPIREVLHQLVREGLLTSQRNCGVRVAPPAPDAVRELLMPMRVQVETYALRTCFAGLTRDDFAQWDRLLGGLLEACGTGSAAAVFERDCDFHSFLLRRAGLAELVPLWTTIVNRTMSFYEHDLLDPADLPVVHAVHAALLDRFRGGELAPSLEALEQHILNGEFNQRVHANWFRARR
jgi:DNA-binding GntR family transcriptional regulator